MFVLGLFSGCSVNYALSDQEPNNHAADYKANNTTDVDPKLSPEQKAIIAKERQEFDKIQRIKCQDAKLDLVEAEADKNRGQINQVLKRMQKYCNP